MINSLGLFGQSISGRFIDSTNNLNLENVSVMALNPTDSILIGYTRTNKSGAFELKNMQSKSIILMATSPGYADYLDRVEIQNNQLELGNMNMIQMSQLIEAVFIKAQRGKMKIKGDTLIYLADSFKTKANATVEDLLKKLPGLQVNRNGEITAQGKKIQRVLVDGEEFFGEDPTIATRNLDAQNVKEVKVYDAQSDEAKRTGDNTASKVKTLDIRLNEDSKKGYFGKIGLASSTDLKFSEQRLLFSSFKAKRKFSLFGLSGNTANIGMNWNERNEYGSGNDFSINADGSTTSSYSSDDNLSSSNGLPSSKELGMVYSNQWGKHKLNMNTSYKDLGVINRNMSKRIQLLTNKEFWNVSEMNDTSNKNQFKISGNWDYQIDSVTSLLVTAKGIVGGSLKNSIYNGLSSLNQTDTLNNQGKQGLDSSLSYSFNTNMRLSHNFSKKGRILSGTMALSTSNTNGANRQNSINLFRNQLNGYDQVLLNQNRNNSTKSQTFGATINYIEPLNKAFDLTFGVDYNLSKQWNLLDVYNSSGGIIKIDSLGNNYQLGQSKMSGNFGLQWHNKKWNVSAGLRPQTSNILQDEKTRQLNLDKSYSALLPSVNVVWNYSKTGSINLFYNAQVNLPTASMLQPILNNANPLYVSKGNTKLSQGLSHNYGWSYHGGNMLKQSWYMLTGNFNYYASNFISTSNIDSLGRTLSSTEMGNGNYNLNSWLYLNKGISGTPISLGLSAGINRSSTQIIQNAILGKNMNQSLTIQPTTYIELGEIFMIDLQYDFTRYSNTSELFTSFSNVNYIQSVSAGINLGPFNKTTFDKKAKTKDESNGWSLSFDYQANFRQQTSIYNVPNNKLVNGQISYTYKKEREIIFSLKVNDLLNQNISYSRYVSGNQIYETTNSAFKRYLLLNVVYKFKNKPKSSTNNETSNEIGSIK